VNRDAHSLPETSLPPVAFALVFTSSPFGLSEAENSAKPGTGQGGKRDCDGIPGWARCIGIAAIAPAMPTMNPMTPNVQTCSIGEWGANLAVM